MPRDKELVRYIVCPFFFVLILVYVWPDNGVAR